MKKKNISKKVLAVLLSFIMLVTSIPFMLVGSAAGGQYDPAPVFSEAAIEEGATAWVDDEGNVQVTFPDATVGPTYAEYKAESADGDAEPTAEELAARTKTLYYVLKLIDMGTKQESHREILMKTIKVEDDTASSTQSATFAAADIGTLYLENKRYSVTITAVDNENWFSQSIYSIVTDVPAVNIDASRFLDEDGKSFSTSSTAVREMMTFDQTTTDTAVTTGDQILYMGTTAQTGTDSMTGAGDTVALRFVVYDQPTGTQTFDTSYSRQTWSYANATEVWYWMDLSDVELEGVSFRLRANEKVWYDWGKDQSMTVTQKDYMGDIIYSTKGYTGTDGYVYVQREDGGWDKVSLTNGTVDIGNFKGYVRVPLEFICSENASYAQLKNTGFNNGATDFATGWNSATLTNGDNHANGIPITKTLVDEAGTNIKDARLMQHRIVATKTGIGGLGNENYWHFTNGTWTRNETEGITRGEDAMIAAGLSEAEAVNDADEGYKAIDDIYAAGFAFEGCSEDSLSHDFYIDNIFFYDKEGGPWSENAVSGMAETQGSAMSSYYDEKATIQNIILDEIDEYLETPGWEDFKEIGYILELIAGYVEVYDGTELDTDATKNNYVDWLTYDSIAAAATAAGRDSWNNALTAYAECLTEQTIEEKDGTIIIKSNADKTDLVPGIVRRMEKLPLPENITTVSEALRIEIIKLWKAYALLNLGQLEMLGEEEEATILEYIALLDGMVSENYDEFVVGQKLADYPYLVFNDFEKQAIGTEGWQLEDDRNAYTSSYVTVDSGKQVGTGALSADWKHLKGLVTYTTYEDAADIVDGDYYGYNPNDTDQSIQGKVFYNASKATITDNGYMNSHAATVDIDASFIAETYKKTYHTVTVTRNGQDSATITEAEANSTGLDSLGNYVKSNMTGTTDRNLSLIAYVDFSELSSYYFTVNIYAKDGDTYIKCRTQMGITASAQKYIVLDPTTGEWIEKYSGNQYTCSSEKISNDDVQDTIDINNFKGYIMIPLYHFKYKAGTLNEQPLDENATWLNNIYAIQFCVGGINDTSLDGKSFSIDNIGFTYDPNGYAMGATHLTYAERFEAKSLPASQFEDAVDAIDPFDESTIDAAVVNARALFDALPEYQQEVVADAEKVLQTYEAYAADHSTIPQPAYLDTAEFNNVIAAIPQLAREAKVKGKSDDGTIDYDIIYPGFENTDTTSAEYGGVKYSTYGFDVTKVSETENLDDPTNPYTIIKYYEETYTRYTVAEKAAVDSTSLLNAYNAAKRCTETLTNIKTGTYSFLGNITTLYNCKTKDFVEDDESTTDVNEQVGYDTFLEITASKKKEVQQFWDNVYGKMPYYSKTSVDNGAIYSQLTNTSRGITYYLQNTDSFTVDGETIDGGLITFEAKMEQAYKDAKAKIDADERFSQAELEAIRDLLEEYNAFKPAYYNVTDLYNWEYDILKLFADATIDVFDAETDGNSITQVVLNNDTADNAKATAYVDLTYIAALLDKTVTLEISSDLVLTQISGTSYEAFNSFTIEGFTANTPVTYTYDNLYPDETFTRIPLNIAVDAAAAAKVPQDAVYEGTINIKVYDTDDINAGLTGDELVPIAELPFTVQFQSTNGSVPVVYVVEIPADMAVDWDQTTSKNVSYTVKSATLNKGTLTVGVADNTGNFDTATNTGKLVNGDNSIVYTANNFADVTFDTDITADTQPNPAPEVQIAQKDWDAAAVGRYETKLTYTVVYDDGTT